MRSIDPAPPTAMSTLRDFKTATLPPVPLALAAMRRHVRERFSATVKVMLADGRVLEARTVDISLGGAQLVLPTNLPVHSRCVLQLSLPTKPLGRVRILMAQAKVLSIVYSGRKGGFAAGLRFTALPAASQAALEDYLQVRDTWREPPDTQIDDGSPADRVRLY
jgi:hypothetical protein